MSNAHDPYCYDSGILANKLNLQESKALQRAETRFTALRIAELQLRPVQGNFDFEHLRKIHKAIFQDVYAWAGEPRTVNISKGGTTFANHQFIYTALGELLPKMRADKDLQCGVPLESFTKRLAYYFGEINAAHSFRDGNGRSQREFLREFALSRGFVIAWKYVSRDMMMGASIEAMAGQTGTMAAMLANVTKPLSEHSRMRSMRTNSQKQDRSI